MHKDFTKVSQYPHFGAFLNRCSLTFDPRTANGHLCLSQENRRAEHLISGPHSVPLDAARFDHTWQVLCFQGFTQGQHFWELEEGEGEEVHGGNERPLVEPPAGRASDLCVARRRKESLSGASQHRRIGMLLDYEAGTLSFFGDGQVRLHAFHCAFRGKLFPACWIGEGVSITLCQP
ncbi:hypothetical protein F7725_013801 [Dissostichus mawsoni]|uniref:SPRY-associated domain-containing protein n=1 Tax=Dissostichus mawsoni TaxID=36200 RepID=A0A7J5YV82_DISMA|nr:hypothetical protein F7725_013801 [Dissostichus mawsoni]